MNKRLLKKVKALLLKRSSFLFIGHENPDGDALGSQIALSAALESLGKRCTIWYNQKLVYDKFDFLPLKKIVCAPAIQDNFEAVIVLDTPALACIDKQRRDFIQGKFIINIDHHISNPLYGTFNWVEPEVSSAGEMVYELIKSFKQVKLTEKILVALYVAIVTDTGGFRYSNTTWETHLVVSDLLKQGLNRKVEEYQNKIFDTLSPNGIVLLNKVLSSVKIDKKYGIVWCWITKAMIKSSKAVLEDAEDIVRQVRSVKGTKVALIFKDHIGNGLIKLSLRSKRKNIDVNKIAKIFNGGGHKAASGCVFKKGSRKAIEAKVLRVVRQEIDGLKLKP